MVNTRNLEEAYLASVYRQLLEKQEEYQQLLQETSAYGRDSLQTMSEDIRINFDSYLDNLDTYSLIEMKNREIDQLNLKIQSANETLKKIERLLMSPYFGKIEIDFLEEEAQGKNSHEAFYIGTANFTNDEDETLVYDWRSPIASLFYNNDLGHSSYLVNQNQIEVMIHERRQFIIKKDQLLHFFDTSVAIQDDVLLDALEQSETSEMKAITATIQSEQNTIIRDTTSQNILVNGVAGSGKTSTIMQRIAYLLYQYRNQLSADDLLILSPNHQFIDYIGKVLPSLGEKNPLNVTMIQLVDQLFLGNVESEKAYFQRITQTDVDDQTAVLRSQAFMKQIEQATSLFTEQADFFLAIKKKEKIVISKEVIKKIYDSTPDYPNLREKLQATNDRLLRYWEKQFLKQSGSDAIKDQLLSLPEEMQQKYFQQLITDESPEKLVSYGKQLLQRKYRTVTKQIKQMAWVDEQFLFEEIYQSYTGNKYQRTTPCTLDEAVARLHVRHLLIEKITQVKKFVLIDEVQDYTSAQLLLLLNIFPNARFTLVGDENQGIFNSTTSFEAIESYFSTAGRSVTRYDLLNSYRSSGAITTLFTQYSGKKEKIAIVPVRPYGEEPEFTTAATFDQWLSQVNERQQHTGEQLTVITLEKQQAAMIQQKVERNNQLNIQVRPLSLSKGLEFDHVLIYLTAEPNTPRERRQMYTAISRAMKTVVISLVTDQ
ncbi:hypothetical protein SE1_02685 [Enterococcus hirae EnGen0127]|uniref:HelD family protein n=1 Tax=Enterococcus hirae TaxID=1354 RepID=UPI00032F352A|nr:UvrD-helicase domain-containing protein [Enterococcus hirae]EOF55129.1 hypothetical protein SE1_02685 [Enterococcus hirae EnGen0127]